MMEGAKPAWAVVYTKPQAEDIAQRALERLGHEVYIPRYRRERTGHRPGEPILVRPLFPRYAFLAMSEETQWHAALRAEGVSDFVWRDDQPATICHEIIAGMRIAEASGAFDQLRRRYRPGDDVVIGSGPVAGMIARVIALDNSLRRCTVLLDMLGREVRSSVPIADLASISAA